MAEYGYNTAEELLARAKERGMSIGRVVLLHESETGGRSPDELQREMSHRLEIMRSAVDEGRGSTQKSKSGLSGGDARRMADAVEKRKLPLQYQFARIIEYALAASETNALLGRIVATPTAGSCGVLPGVLLAESERLDAEPEELLEAMFVAAGIGRIIALGATLAGAEAGCAAECGAASAMAAAALSCLYGRDNRVQIDAAALALKNSLGLVCDPVGGYVEVPCIKRNAIFAAVALSAATMAAVGITSVIPFDEVVIALRQVGRAIIPALKEQSEGGLATTETARRLCPNR
jgi:L-serine dehydratase